MFENDSNQESVNVSDVSEQDSGRVAEIEETQAADSVSYNAPVADNQAGTDVVDNTIQNESSQENLQAQNQAIKESLNNEFRQIDNTIKKDLQTIKLLYKQGKVSAQEALGLKEHIEQKAKEDRKVALDKLNSIGNTLGIASFKNQNPDFFNSEVKVDVINRLKDIKGSVNGEDLKQVATMIDNIEKAAVENYKRLAFENEYKDKLNTSAKEKLNSVAQNNVPKGITPRKIFSRSAISEMSTDEFIKYQDEIELQMQQGLIR